MTTFVRGLVLSCSLCGCQGENGVFLLCVWNPFSMRWSLLQGYIGVTKPLRCYVCYTTTLFGDITQDYEEYQVLKPCKRTTIQPKDSYASSNRKRTPLYCHNRCKHKSSHNTTRKKGLNQNDPQLLSGEASSLGRFFVRSCIVLGSLASSLNSSRSALTYTSDNTR